MKKNISFSKFKFMANQQERSLFYEQKYSLQHLESFRHQFLFVFQNDHNYALQIIPVDQSYSNTINDKTSIAYLNKNASLKYQNVIEVNMHNETSDKVFIPLFMTSEKSVTSKNSKATLNITAATPAITKKTETLTFNEVLTLLQNATYFNNGDETIPVRPKAGEIYGFTISSDKTLKKHLRADGYMWRNKKSCALGNGLITKTYIYARVGKTYTNNFEKHEYMLQNGKKALIHYLGNEKSYVDRCHGNSTKSKSFFAQMEEMLELLPCKEITLHYDTTFNLGNYYLSCLAYRHVCLETKRNKYLYSSPTVPFAFFIHEKRLAQNHKYFFQTLKENVCGKNFNKSRKLFISDREFNGSHYFDNTKSLVCWNHLLQNVKEWMRKNGKFSSSEYDEAVKAMKYILQSNSVFEYESRL
nr:uncharacterized protein LOC105850453 isoform X2 [Hydra vulgaris]